MLFFLTNFYFVIESEHAFFSVNKVVYQTRGRCDKLGYKIYWKCSINAFVSNLTILTFSKVMMWHLLGVFVNWATVWAGQAKQRIKPRGWGIQKWGDHVLVNNVHHHSFSWQVLVKFTVWTVYHGVLFDLDVAITFVYCSNILFPVFSWGKYRFTFIFP